jgi:histidinol phosphatase-like enzyme (inositol monophosphatase family)
MSSHESPYEARLKFALAAAESAAHLILKFYQSANLAVEPKRDSSPVTEADRGAELLIRELIEQQFPRDGVLGEEFGETVGSSGYRWILDPVDGTKSFIHGVPLFGTLIGLEHEGDCVVGVCRFPALKETVYASRGAGTWWARDDGPAQRARVSAIKKMSDALFCITTITGWERTGKLPAFERLCKAAGLTRGWGDCYGHILVATGRADVMVDPAMNPWDAAALVPIMEEAGGCFMDWKGNTSIHSGNGVSVNADLREDVLKLLQGE